MFFLFGSRSFLSEVDKEGGQVNPASEPGRTQAPRPAPPPASRRQGCWRGSPHLPEARAGLYLQGGRPCTLCCVARPSGLGVPSGLVLGTGGRLPRVKLHLSIRGLGTTRGVTSDLCPHPPCRHQSQAGPREVPPSDPISTALGAPNATLSSGRTTHSEPSDPRSHPGAVSPF